MGYVDGSSLYQAYYVPMFVDPTGTYSNKCNTVVIIGHKVTVSTLAGRFVDYIPNTPGRVYPIACKIGDVYLPPGQQANYGSVENTDINLDGQGGRQLPNDNVALRQLISDQRIKNGKDTDDIWLNALNNAENEARQKSSRDPCCKECKEYCFYVIFIITMPEKLVARLDDDFGDPVMQAGRLGNKGMKFIADNDLPNDPVYQNLQEGVYSKKAGASVRISKRCWPCVKSGSSSSE